MALVGHEPDLGHLAAKLIGLKRPLEFRKGAVCRIDVDGLPPGGPGQLRWFVPPRMLRAPGLTWPVTSASRSSSTRSLACGGTLDRARRRAELAMDLLVAAQVEPDILITERPVTRPSWRAAPSSAARAWWSPGAATAPSTRWPPPLSGHPRRWR